MDNTNKLHIFNFKRNENAKHENIQVDLWRINRKMENNWEKENC